MFDFDLEVMAALSGGATKLEAETERLKKENQRRESAVKFSDFLLDILIEKASTDDRRTSALVMREVPKVIEKLKELMRFADHGEQSSVTIEDREAVLSFMERLSEEIEEFTSAHPIPKKTIFD